MSEFDTLKWSEMAWMLFNRETHETRYLGEAGNPSYSGREQITAVRYGDQVLVSAGGQDAVIPACLKAKGFGDGIDGLPLSETMEEDRVYNYALRPEPEEEPE